MYGVQSSKSFLVGVKTLVIDLICHLSVMIFDGFGLCLHNQSFKINSSNSFLFFAHKLSESYSYHYAWNSLISFAVLPKFEVKVELPPYLLEKEKALHGKVTVRWVKIKLRGKRIITINFLLTLMVCTIFKRSWILVDVLKSSLNSVKVLEKYLISLLGLEKSLKFTTLCVLDTRFL